MLKKRIALSFILLLLKSFSGVGFSQTLTEEQKLIAQGGHINANFGYDVAIDGTTAVITACYAPKDDGTSYCGAVYIFEKSGGEWQFVKRLQPSDLEQSALFGYSVSISGDDIVVGARNDNAIDNNGAAYIFNRNQGGADNWGLAKKLTGNSTKSAAFFGFDVCVLQDTLFVGSVSDSNEKGDRAGAVYVYERDQGGTDNWGLVKKILASDGAAHRSLGFSVSLQDDFAVAGSPGKAYVFKRDVDGDGSDDWTEVKILSEGDANVFGRRVSIDNDVIVADDFSDNGSQGAVYIFGKDQDGPENWGLVKKLTSDVTEQDFGQGVDLSGDYLVVSSEGTNEAYIFSRNLGGADNWGQEKSFSWITGYNTNSVMISGETLLVGGAYDASYGSATFFTDDGSKSWSSSQVVQAYDPYPGASFGKGAAFDGDNLFIGAPSLNEIYSGESGRMTIFTKDGSGKYEQQRTQGTFYRAGALKKLFGYSVAVSGDWMAVGDVYSNIGGPTNSGAVYLYKWENETWTYKDTKYVAEPALLGYALDMEGDWLTVSAPGTNGGQGSIYVYNRNTGGTDNWGFFRVLNASDGAASDSLGINVDLDGVYLIAGAHEHDSLMNNVGAAYIWKIDTGSEFEILKISPWVAGENFGFGYSVAIEWFGSSGQFAVGEPGFGRVYVGTFDQNSYTLTDDSMVRGKDTSNSDSFGYSIDMAGDLLLIGARDAVVDGENTGAAYLFSRRAAGGGWSQYYKLLASDRAAGDVFGSHVKLNGTRAYVAAILNDEKGPDSGAGYLFDIPDNTPPTASNFALTGEFVNGGQVTVTYDYFDADGDPEGETLFYWYRASDASGSSPQFRGVTSTPVYPITSGEVNKYISVDIHPVASSGVADGNYYEAAPGWNGPVTERTTPTVSTAAVSNITSTSAVSGGTVSSTGGWAVTARGICWNTSGTPTTADSVVTSGAGLGAFTSTMTGLQPGQTYYVRAYATNALGTSYGGQTQFTTYEDPTISGRITDGTNAIAGVSVTPDGGSAVLTDANGDYSFEVAYGWSGNVTPAKTGYNFTPSAKAFSNVTSNQTQNFTGALNTYTINGTITDGASGLPGVVLSISTGGSVSTDGSGNYIVNVEHGWSGTLTPTKNNYSFNPVNRSYSSVSGNQTAQNYTATPDTYTVSVSSTAGGSTDKDGDNEVEHGGSITINANPETGYQFTGWSGDASGTDNPLTISNVTSGKSVTANFAKIQYTVAVSSSTGGSTDKDGDNSVEHGGSITINANPDTGYQFTGWSGDASGTDNPLTISNVTSGKSVTANFAKIQYTVAVSSSTGGSTDKDGDNSVEHGGSITINANPDTGYQFTGWSGDASGTDNPLTISNVTAGKSVTANFAKIQYTVAVTSTAGGSTDKDGDNSVEHDGSITINANPDTGYQFTGWSGDASGTDNPVTISNVTSGKSVTANFAKIQYTVAVSSSTGGSTDKDGDNSVEHGGSITINANPETGYQFIDWTGDVNSTDNPLILSDVQADATITANFELTTLTLSGQVTDGANPIAGVEIEFSHDNSTTTTDANGDYSKTVDYGTTTTATLTLTGYTFDPQPHSFDNVTEDTTQDFTGTLNQYQISGTVTNGTAPLEGVTIAPDGLAEVTSGSDGSYNITVTHGWSGRVSVSKTGYSFTPDYIDYTDVTGNIAGQNYDYTIKSYTVSGTVTDGKGSALDGVTIGFSHNSSSVITASGGLYSTTLTYGTSTVITPVLSNYEFTPDTRTINTISEDQVADFVGTMLPGSLQVAIQPDPVVQAGAQWQIVGTGNWYASGDTVNNLSPGTYTIAFSEVGGWNTPARQNVEIVSNVTTTSAATYTVRNYPPIIHYFTATPATIGSRDNSSLSWQVDGATSIEIMPDVGVVVSAIGSVEVTPNINTTYTLSATNATGTTTAVVTVTVAEIPTVVWFTSSTTEDNPINPDGEALLEWGVRGATQLEIARKTRRGTSKARNPEYNSIGSMTVSPNKTTTYVLTATNSAGSVKAEAEVHVRKTPEIMFFNAIPSKIVSGDEVTFSWSVVNADSLELLPEVGTIDNQSTEYTFTPANETQTLVATNRAGSSSATVELEIVDQADACDLAVKSAILRSRGGNVKAGDIVKIRAKVQNSGDLKVNDIPVTVNSAKGIAEPVIIKSLRAGQKKNVNLMYHALDSGQHDINIHADPAGLFPDSERSNNTLQVQQHFEELPGVELIVVDTVLNLSMKEGFGVVTATIRNIGSVDSESCQWVIWGSKRKLRKQELLASGHFDGLKAGESKTVSKIFSLFGYRKKLWLATMVDFHEAIRESDELNNLLRRQFDLK